MINIIKISLIKYNNSMYSKNTLKRKLGQEREKTEIHIP